MYYKVYKNDILSELEVELIHSKALIKEWGKVEIKKKKDGSEYRELTKSCLINATASKVPLYFTNDPIGYEVYPTMKISVWTDKGYVSDTIQIYDEWKDGMDERRKINTKYHIFQFNSAKEIREKISKRIEELKQRVVNLEDAIKALPDIYDKFVADCEQAEANMIANAKENKEITIRMNCMIY